MEAHGTGPEGLYDKAKQAIRLETDRPHVLRQMMMACRKGSTLAIINSPDSFPETLGFSFFIKACNPHSFVDQIKTVRSIDHGSLWRLCG